MRRALHGATLLCGFLAAAGAGAEEDLSRQDFAFGRSVRIAADAPLQTLLLDLRVYRGSIEPGLADLRVMNSAGESVPHAVRQLNRSSPEEAETRSLPLFALRDSGSHEPLSERMHSGKRERAYGIRAEVSESGAIVEIESEPRSPEDVERPPRAFLLDASQLERPIERLVLDLAPGGADFVVPVRVEASDDLVRFASLGERAVLVRLEQDGHQIDQSQVELPPTRRRYLRISWPEATLPVEVLGVRAQLAPRLAAPPRERTRVPALPVADEEGAFLFDLGGEVPVDRAQIHLPQGNTLVQTRVFTGRSEAGPWKLRYDGILYDLQYGEPLRNPELHWPAERQRFVKLVVAPRGGGLGAGAPELEVGWHPDQLLFVRRGEPPFQLVYGRYGAAPTPFDAAELLGAWRPSGAEPPRESARLGEELPLGDASVLEPAPAAPPYRSWALWGVLVLAVAAVLTLSGSLLRQMRART